MIYFLTSHSLWLSGFIIIGLGTLLATLGPTVVRHFVDLKRLSANNEIAGFKFATVGVLYAVLLAFAIIVVWQKYSDAETTVAQAQYSSCRTASTKNLGSHCGARSATI
jgi:Na+/proline symporter